METPGASGSPELSINIYMLIVVVSAMPVAPWSICVGWTCIQERSEQRVELSILVQFSVTIFLTLRLSVARATKETRYHGNQTMV